MLSVRLQLALMTVLAIDLCCVLLLVSSGSEAFYQENGLLENAQLIVLALGIVAHAWRSRHAVSVFEQRLFAALCLLSLAICYREADLQSLLPLDSALRSALHIAKPVVTPPLWLAAAIVLGRCLGADWRRTRSFLSSDVALLVGGCAVMMVLAVLLDKSVIHFPGPDRFFEELLELSAYLYLLVTTLAQRTEAHEDSPLIGARGLESQGDRGSAYAGSPARARQCQEQR
ncbi:MAG: hypothetical protein IPJ33_03145 [Gammaproteobacteria bacterium]|jgi:hypothetical protein|nr:hypothetical protein [Gammaproteobacteria bacterium]MBK6583668.1 hypothetical protein [Gammaproteobacteria bacterium]MBK7522007.1 hypothetical protein [Gammaproteobacteria bacterium]MBK7727519.1 hypothetical protein [Gammaproteobacteria bacterium]MBK9665477.1 hypothetical protein [Gammaproteobacteria bacterium]